MDRQGPGGDEQTRTALGLIRHLLPTATRAADIGCGTGRQTAVLASEPGVSVTAVDLLPEMVEGMKERMRRLGLQDRVEGVVASMDALPFREGSFDLFWAEGSVYNIGFRRGLVEWRRFLRPGGCIAVTECSWLSEERPAEGMEYFDSVFPGMKSAAENVLVMQECGYVPVAHFVLPPSCWLKNYYGPMEARIVEFLAGYRGDAGAAAFTMELQEEIRHYREHGRFYGYVFYIGQRPGT